MSIIIKSGSSGNLASVDSGGRLLVNAPTSPSVSGFVAIAGETHSGVSGLARLVRPVAVSMGRRLRTGNRQNLLYYCFNPTVVDGNIFQCVTATATIAQTGGFLSFNSGNSVASGAVARVQTYRTFPIAADETLIFEARIRFSNTPVVNNVCEFGMGFAATTATPTDGIYFKLASTGVLQGVINVNGAETTTADLPAPAINDVHSYTILMRTTRAEFYIDDMLVGVLEVAATTPGLSFSRGLPVLLREYNSAATSGAQRMEISDLILSADDSGIPLRPELVSIGAELGAYHTQRGAVIGQSANYANSAAPASATLSNTAPSYTTLGGQWQYAAVGSAETDNVLFAYTVAAPAAAGANMNLVVTGIRIEMIVTGAAVATTPSTVQWGLGVGATAGSLATADSISAGTRAGRRLTLGYTTLPVGAVVGSVAQPLDITFSTPLFLGAGTVLQIIAKNVVGTATASQVLRGTILVNGYFTL